MAKTLEDRIAQTIRWAATRAIGTPHMPVEEVIKHATADAMRALAESRPPLPRLTPGPPDAL